MKNFKFTIKMVIIIYEKYINVVRRTHYLNLHLIMFLCQLLWLKGLLVFGRVRFFLILMKLTPINIVYFHFLDIRDAFQILL